jgi:sugar phosphate isomerase/epimerase
MISAFGMDTITLNWGLEAKLAAMKAAGFEQVMLMARDLVGHPEGVAAAVQAVKQSGLRPTGFQVLRDFEGLSGDLHAYKVSIAQSMLTMCAAVGSPLLLVCSSTSRHATDDLDHMARDLRKLAMMALPLGIRIAYEALSWGRVVNEYSQAWDLVCRADCPNLGLALDSFHMLASQSPLDGLAEVDPSRLYLVQLSDFMWQETPTFEERISTARTFRVFPGEGVHSPALTELVLAIDRVGYAGDYSFEVFNDDYQQLPLPDVALRAKRAALWLGQDVLRKAVPLPLWTRQRQHHATGV